MKKILLISLVCILVAAGFIYKTILDVSVNYHDGVWNGTGYGHNGKIEVAVVIKDNTIISGSILREKEADFAKPAAQIILNSAINRGNLDEYDAVTGATVTSKGTAQAIYDALEKASGKEVEKVTYTDTTCDIAIIGAGGAGLSAAVEAAMKGYRVILLEKMDIVGGNTLKATSGINAAGTNVQKCLGITDSKEQFYQDTMKIGDSQNDPQLVKKLTESAPETVDWLISVGVELLEIEKMAGSTTKRAHRPLENQAFGPHVIKALYNAALGANVDIRTSSEVTDLIFSGNKIQGVKVSFENREYTINSKAVIIATGGFGANPTLIEKYQPELTGAISSNHEGATGDAIEWAEKLDMALVQMDKIQAHPTVSTANNALISRAIRSNGAIMVNKEGKRFCSETSPRNVLTKAIKEQPEGKAFLLFDNKIRTATKSIDSYEQTGQMKKRFNLEDLSWDMAVPYETLNTTITGYNSAVRTGIDIYFVRSRHDMPLEIKEPPYYAIEVTPGIQHTMGGIKITPKTEVLNSNNQTIQGLFAAGEVTGGVHGANRMEGNAMTDIFVFGRTAAQSAIEYVTSH